LRDGHDGNRFNQWAGEKGIIVKRRDAPRGWTNEVPIKKVRATQINLDRLRAVVEGD
jgi:hypothetical protein